MTDTERQEYEQALNEAVCFILGGGLDDEGKQKWLAAFADQSPLQRVRHALRLTEGMICT